MFSPFSQLPHIAIEKWNERWLYHWFKLVVSLQILYFEAPLFTCKFNAQANQCCDPNSLRKQLANNILARSFGFIIVHAL
jgi:hypothetical protein